MANPYYDPMSASRHNQSQQKKLSGYNADRVSHGMKANMPSSTMGMLGAMNSNPKQFYGEQQQPQAPMQQPAYPAWMAGMVTQKKPAVKSDMLHRTPAGGGTPHAGSNLNWVDSLEASIKPPGSAPTQPPAGATKAIDIYQGPAAGGPPAGPARTPHAGNNPNWINSLEETIRLDSAAPLAPVQGETTFDLGVRPPVNGTSPLDTMEAAMYPTGPGTWRPPANYNVPPPGNNNNWADSLEAYMRTAKPTPAQPPANPSATPTPNGPPATPIATPTPNGPPATPSTPPPPSRPLTPQEILNSYPDQQAVTDSRNRINREFGSHFYDTERQIDTLKGRNDRTTDFIDGKIKRPPPGAIHSPYVAGDAAGFNDMMATSAAADEENRLKHEARMNSGRATVAANNAAMEKEGIEDPDQARLDVGKVNAQYNTYKRGGGDLSFGDYARAFKYQNGLSDDAMKIISKNYPAKSQGEMPFTSDSVNEADINGPRQVAQAEAKAQRDARDAAQAEGLQRRQAQAAEQSLAQSRAASAISHGANPALASQYAQAYGMNEQAVNNQRQFVAGEAQKERQSEIDFRDAEVRVAAQQKQEDILNSVRSEFNNAMQTGAFESDSEIQGLAKQFEDTYGLPRGTVYKPTPGSPGTEQAREKLAAAGSLPEGIAGLQKFGQSITGVTDPAKIQELAQYSGVDISPESLRAMHAELKKGLDEHAQARAAEMRKNGQDRGNPETQYKKGRDEYLRDKKGMLDVLSALAPGMEDLGAYVPSTYENVGGDGLLDYAKGVARNIAYAFGK